MVQANSDSSVKEIKEDDESIIPSQVGSVMRTVWGANRVPFLWGPPGIGKSDLLKQQATARGIAYIDIRLATKSPSQIAGVPMPMESHGEMMARYAVPNEFPRDLDIDHVMEFTARKRVKFEDNNPRGSNGIHYCTNPEINVEAVDKNHVATIVKQGNDFFTVELRDLEGNMVKGSVLYTITGKAKAVMCFDELSSANPSVQAVAFSLILDGRLGQYVFPEGVDVAAAGNREEDRGVVYKMTHPLKNRFAHYTLKVWWPDWIAHAKLVGAYPAIIRMHEEHKGRDLFKFDPMSDANAWPSPRTWMMLSDIEFSLDRRKVTDPKLRLAHILATVGKGVALTYNTYKEKYADLPLAADILAGNPVERKRYDTSNQMFISTNVVWSLREVLKEMLTGSDRRPVEVLRGPDGDEFYRQANNALAYMMETFRPDLLAGVVRNMSMQYKLPLDPNRMPAFKAHLEKNNAIIV
jgi:MoxR-like ATPase